MSSCTRKMYGGRRGSYGLRASLEENRKKAAKAVRNEEARKQAEANQAARNEAARKQAETNQAVRNEAARKQAEANVQAAQAAANAQAKLALLKNSVVTAARQAAINSASFPGNISSRFSALANEVNSQTMGGKRRTRRTRRTRRRRN